MTSKVRFRIEKILRHPILSICSFIDLLIKSGPRSLMKTGPNIKIGSEACETKKVTGKHPSVAAGSPYLEEGE